MIWMIQMNPFHRNSVVKLSNAGYLAALGLGITMGFLTLFLADREVRWIIYTVAGLVSITFILAIPDKRSLLMTVFILSLQVNVHLRFLYGHAGSTDGLAIPLVVVTGIALLSWYAGSGHLKEFKWAGSMRVPIAALLATTLLSLTTTSERFVGVTALWYGLELYFLYWLTFNTVQTEDDFKRVIKLLFFTLGVQGIVYIIQSKLGLTFDLVGNTEDLGEVPRPGGTVSTNPDGFASFIMPALLMAITNFAAQEHFMPRRYVFFAIALGIAAIGLTFTRAPWIGLLMGLAFVVIYGYRRRFIKFGMIMWIIAAAVVALALLLPTMLDRVQSNYGVDATMGTLDERLGLIQIALNIITAHPITGIGPGAYGYVFKAYVPAGMDQWLFTVHNEFLRRAAETGVPGALAFVVFLVIGFRVALRLTRSELSLISVSALGWLAALIALVWQMNWVPWGGWSYNAMLWIMLGLMDGAQRLVARNEGCSAKQEATDNIGGTLRFPT
jgi:hypothetical protein